jgi:hypothetical protein
MAVLHADDPADGLHRVCQALSLHVDGEPQLTDGYEATRRDFQGIGLGTFGPWVLLVGKYLDWEIPESLFEGSAQGLAFFASENRGGTNHVRLFEGGQPVAHWEEAGEKDEHPLFADIPEDTHPFDLVGLVVERVVGAKPLELLDRPMFQVIRSR